MTFVKKNFRPIFSLLLVLLMSLCFAGCNMDMDDVLTLKRAYKHISGMDSASYSISAQLEAKAGSLPLDLELAADCRSTRSPMVTQIQADLGLGKLGDVSLPLYLYLEGSTLHLLSGLGNDGDTLWIERSIQLPLAEASEPGDEDDDELWIEAILNFLQAEEDALTTGDPELIDGRQAQPFYLNVPGELIMDSLAFDAPKGSSLGELSFTIWIESGTGLPLRISSELSELLQYALDCSDPSWLPNIQVSAFPLTIDITGLNDVDSIGLPLSEPKPTPQI